VNELLLEARGELKRLEHLIYVSLKYSRTVDVIKNALDRLVAVFDYIIEAFMEKAMEEGLIESLPKSPALRATRLTKMYPKDEKLANYLNFYAYLKTILKLPFARRREYRRHVTFIVELDKSTCEVDIDCLESFEKYTHSFLGYAHELIVGKKEDAEE
jgi:hypothetical protein